MKPTIHFTEADYIEIASTFHYEESGKYEVEYEKGSSLLIVALDFKIEYRSERGGSYEDYDFEVVMTACNESINIIDWNSYDADGNEISNDFDPNKLIEILN